MAKKRKAAKRRRKAGKRKAARKPLCKVTRVKGQGMRRICRDKKGRIKSNTKAR